MTEQPGDLRAGDRLSKPFPLPSGSEATPLATYANEHHLVIFFLRAFT